MSKKTYYTRILLLVAIVISLAILSGAFSFRFDFTGDQRYTLSPATIDLLDDLKQVVTVKAYFSKDLPPNIADAKEGFEDLLTEYEKRSGGKIAYEFINPTESEEVEQKVMQKGIRPVMLSVRKKDEITQQKAYLGATLSLGDREEVIPIIQPGAAMEYTLSSTIKKLSLDEKSKVALLTGHGAAHKSEMQQIISVLSDLYEINEVKLSGKNSDLSSHEAFLIVAPDQTFLPNELNVLETELKKGKDLLLALNTVDGDFTQNKGKTIETGLAAWLKKYGITVQQQFAIDASCGTVSVRQQQGMLTYNTPVQFPYLPMIQKFPDHSITKGLENIVLPFASPISIDFSNEAIQADTLISTSSKSGTRPANAFFDITKQWDATDFGQSNIPLGFAIKGPVFSENESKFVLFSDADFPVNGSGRQARELNQDNVSLFVNAVEWLSDDTGLNALRTKGRSSRPIQVELEEKERNLIKYANFLAPVFLVLLYGIFRWQLRKRKRRKLKQTDMS